MNLHCFLMMQFSGANQEEIFRRIEEAINRFNTVTQHSVSLARADLTPPLDIQSLENHLKKQIDCCDFAIAEISQLNPNVLFEMGYAIGHGRPVIILVQKTVKVPADFRGRLYVEYGLEDLDLLPQRLQDYLRGAIDSILAKRHETHYSVPAYSTRSVSDIRDRMAKGNEKIDILTTNLYSLLKGGHIETIRERLAVRPALRVRILTLDPESDFAAHRARQVGISTRHLRDQLRDALEETSDLLSDFPEQCRIATYNEFPTQIAFRIDDRIFFHVVSANRQSRYNILLVFSEFNAGVADCILSHFDTVWGRATTVHRK